MTALTARAISSANDKLKYPVIPESDHGALKEYSVIHTDRSLNLMSVPFGKVMRDLDALLKHTYNANKVAIIPGYVADCWYREILVVSCQRNALKYSFADLNYFESDPQIWYIWYGSCSSSVRTRWRGSNGVAKWMVFVPMDRDSRHGFSRKHAHCHQSCIDTNQRRGR